MISADMETMRAHCNYLKLGYKPKVSMRDLHSLRDALLKSGERELASDLETIESADEFHDFLVNAIYGDE